MRINRYLAQYGTLSRRASEELIRDKRVSVNGAVTTDLSTQIKAGDVVAVDGRALAPITQSVYIMMNKPRGVITSCNDEKGRRTVLDVLGDIGFRVFPVGRLDYDTAGLLLLTNDGDFAHAITHPASQITKTYVARLDSNIESEHAFQLQNGVYIAGKMTAPARVNIIDPRTVEIQIIEGQNRQIRRMLSVLGLNVVSLRRTAIGNLTLGKMKPGEWKYIEKSLPFCRK